MAAPVQMILFIEFGYARFDKGESQSSVAIRDGKVLERALAPHLSKLDLVLTDQLAFHQSLGTIRTLLPDAIAARVVDSVYIDPIGNNYDSLLATHYNCIRQWLLQNNATTKPWLALEQKAQSDWPTAERARRITGPLSRVQVEYDLVTAIEGLLAAGPS